LIVDFVYDIQLTALPRPLAQFRGGTPEGEGKGWENGENEGGDMP